MTASWKILGFAAGLALVGTAGACTVTTNNGGDDDGGFFDDDSGAGNDTSTTTDTGITPPACADEKYPDGGSQVLSLDRPGSGVTTCTTCTETNCCTQLSACFQDPTGDCQDLESCLQACIDSDPSDAGSCSQDCADLHPNSVNLHNAWGDCQTSSCASACPN